MSQYETQERLAPEAKRKQLAQFRRELNGSLSNGSERTIASRHMSSEAPHHIAVRALGTEVQVVPVVVNQHVDLGVLHAGRELPPAHGLIDENQR